MEVYGVQEGRVLMCVTTLDYGLRLMAMKQTKTCMSTTIEVWQIMKGDIAPQLIQRDSVRQDRS